MQTGYWQSYQLINTIPLGLQTPHVALIDTFEDRRVRRSFRRSMRFDR
jgi:hypothetical protein